MRVGGVPATFDAPGMYRIMFPMGELAKRGHEIFIWPHEIEELHDRPDMDFKVHFDMNKDPGPYDVLVLGMRLEKLWMGNFDYVYDIDDWLHDLPDWNPAKAGTDPKTGMANRDLQPFIIAKADLVTASTPFIADRVSKWNSNTTLIRNYLHWPMWENVTPRYDVDTEGKVIIGWMGHPSWRRGDLELIREIVGSALRRHKNLMFASGGYEETHDIVGVPEDRRITYKNMSFFKKHMMLHTLLGFDIGLIPLVDIPFNEAKSHLKGMEYNACGIPFVASNTESYRYYTREGENGFIARSEKDWADRIDMLVEDADLLDSMARKSRAIAAMNTVERNWFRWANAWGSVAH